MHTHSTDAGKRVSGILAAVILAVVARVAGDAARAVTIDLVNVGDAGNADQSGNVWEWNDYTGTASTSSRGLRGGYYDNGPLPDNLSSGVRASAAPSTKSWQYGFRLANGGGISPSPGPGSVPEIDPAGIGSVLALVTGALGWIERRRAKGA